MLYRMIWLGQVIVLASCLAGNDCSGPLLLEKVSKATLTEISSCLGNVDNVDYQDVNGNTALSFALMRGDGKIVRQLIKAGANPLMDGGGDVSLARLAARHANPKLLSQLKQDQLNYWRNQSNPYTMDNLRICLEHDNEEILQKFVDDGFAMDSQIVNGITPVVLAALAGSSASVDLLINLGIDPDSEFDTRSLLSIAAMFGYANIAKTLIEAHADLDNYEGAHTTALMFAAENNHLSIVKMLLDAGADAKLYDKNGETALDKARKKNYTNIVDLLHENNN